ncbi:MAG: methyltransferase domain-containing protein [Verrucomicrobiota bacterium]
MTDWEGRWQRGETPWNKGAPAPPLMELLDSEHGDCLKGRRVLVPGCGSGEDVRELARSGAMVTGLDLSPTVLEIARSESEGLSAKFVCENLFEWDSKPFDAIWEHTCFCAIDPSDRARYAEAVARLIRPGGVLTGVFYLEPWGQDEAPEPPPFGSRKEEILELLDPAFEMIWGRTPENAFSGREGREWLAVFRRRDADRGVAVRESGR